MSLPPIIYHSFARPLPYLPTLLLQQKIHEYQLRKRRAHPDSHPDVLLLLEHRPVYTAGRRQTATEVQDEALRLRGLGADVVATQRGGQTTYHGPGQAVGYPLVDLRRMQLSIADYVCKLQTSMKRHFVENYGIRTVESDNTGVFLSSDRKIASIGVQVRHRLTSHGFAYNVSGEPLAWFDRVIACGLANVRATSISVSVSEAATATAAGIFSRENLVVASAVEQDLNKFVPVFASVFGRELVKLDLDHAGRGDGEIEGMIKALEEEAVACGSWSSSPKSSPS